MFYLYFTTMSLANFEEEYNEREPGKPSRKKPIFPIQDRLRNHLRQHGREVKLPVLYRDLLRFTYSVPIKDKYGVDTLWESVLYDMRDFEFIREGLVKIYAQDFFFEIKIEQQFADGGHQRYNALCCAGLSSIFQLKGIYPAHQDFWARYKGRTRPV